METMRTVRECAGERNGVRVERRALFGFSLAAAAGAALPGARPVDPFAELGFEAFAEAWGELAGELRPAGPAADAVYLGRLEALAARLRRPELPDYVVRNEGKDSVGGPIWSGSGLFVVRFDLEPGAVIRPHDHYPMAVLTVGVAGECHYRHFEPENAPGHASRKKFTVRETRSGWLTPGRSTGLTRRRDVVHTFRAGARGASIVDLVCPLVDSDDWSYVSIGDEATDEEGRVFEAQWLGKKP